MLPYMVRSCKSLVALGTQVGTLPAVLPLVSDELVFAGECPSASCDVACIGPFPCRRDRE